VRTDYSDVFQDPTAVQKYADVVYAPDTYASAISARQRAWLRRLVLAQFRHRRPVQHDFGCGTGRAVRLLSGLVRSAHGYDSSPAMLERARDSGLVAQWHTIPESGDEPEPVATGGPCLVTVFRVLLNAPEETRDRAVGFATKVLPLSDSGLLVVENHGNASSLRHLARRRHAGDPWFNELSHAEVTGLLTRHGFSVIARRGFALFPPGAYRRAWLRPVARRLDDILCRSSLFSRFATDVLYVARRGGVDRPRRRSRE
jgi:SAM-dependent methyltransferase